MPHSTPLIATIVIGLGLAFVLSALLHRAKVPPLVGYLLAGIAIGPFTPGFVGDQAIATQLAEIGVILLMFGVGLHFSLEELLSVRAIAIPGALAQIACATALGLVLALWLGWSWPAGLTFGLALSVASTVVLLRAFQERRLIETERGRIAVGWLIVEDLVMVLALVLLPGLAGLGNAGDGASPSLLLTLAWTLAKVVGFAIVMLILGKRLIPWVLHYVAHTGSRELFRLAVLAIALGAAYWAAELFGVSFALGAFFAGMILSESQLSQRAAQETLPLRDAFAVLFFVSVGMLFDPNILLREPMSVAATIVIIVIGKSAAAFAIVKLFRYSTGTALTVSASLAQIGEFSFILAGLAVSLDLLPATGRDLILAGAIVSILLNPLLFSAIDHWSARRDKSARGPADDPEQAEPAALHPIQRTTLTGHIVLVGHGRVGRTIAADLQTSGAPLLIVDSDPHRAQHIRQEGLAVINGNAADPDVLGALNLEAAQCLLLAIPDGFEAGQVIEQARTINPNLHTVVRAHSADEIKHLESCGAHAVITGESLIAAAMVGEARAILHIKRGPAAEAPGEP